MLILIYLLRLIPRIGEIEWVGGQQSAENKYLHTPFAEGVIGILT